MAPTLTLEERFWSKVVRGADDECWLWQGAVSSTGYGNFAIAGKTHRAHRVAFELLVGEIPPGLQTDHLCLMPLCVNPAHMEVVTQAENLARRRLANRSKTHCVQGHPFDAANTYVPPRQRRRECRECSRQASRRYKARVRSSQ